MSKDQEPDDAVLERSTQLPDEIREAHQTGADYLKWKLIIVAALGAAALGLTDKGQPMFILLALIPFVCIYVDLLCADLAYRVIIIGTFYAEMRHDLYERYTQRNRNLYQSGDWAVHYSTYGICFVVAAVGLVRQYLLPPDVRSFLHWPLTMPILENDILISAALVGLISACLTQVATQRLMKKLTPVADLSRAESTSLDSLMRDAYDAQQFEALNTFIMQKGVFIFHSLPNGLFPAAAVGANDASGYQNVWVRDNIHVAHAHYACGDTATAARTLSTLMRFFQKERHRFHDIIEDRPAGDKPVLADNPMNRPHIRFDGRELKELDQKWSHAQNDALGYFLWCYSKLARQRIVSTDDGALRCLGYFVLYFEAIQYWQDADSGHWEETPKVQASSIGCVVAGLREFRELMKELHWPDLSEGGARVDSALLDRLCARGEAALDQILPCESISPENCYRRYDSALLFLIYPLGVLDCAGPHASLVLQDVKTHLQGDYGIRRYLGDSYWFPDYKKVPRGKRTSDFSGGIEERNAHLRLGDEAQWCIFDPIMSVIYGQRYLFHKESGDAVRAAECLRWQTFYLNRSLSQLTRKSGQFPDYRAPEAYFLEKGRYVPNDHTPLLWTQANLWLALHHMQASLAAAADHDQPQVHD